MNAEAVGYLLPHLAVFAQAVVGDWAKVRYHKKRTAPLAGGSGTTQEASPAHVSAGGGSRGDGWGWCLVRDPLNADRTFLKSTTMSNASPPPPQATAIAPQVIVPPQATAAGVTKDQHTTARNSQHTHAAFGDHGSNDEVEEEEDEEESKREGGRDSGDSEMNVSQVGSRSDD